MKKPLKIGHIGWLKYDEGPDCRTVAWCDTNEEKLRTRGKDHPEIALFTDYREMLRQADLDLVSIASPNFAHADQAVAFLEAGKHVFLEKPMGVDAAEHARILQAWRRSGKNLGIDFEIRVSPCLERIQALIGSGRYGRLRRIEYFHHCGAWLQSGSGLWRLRPETSGGFLLECPIHYVDICRSVAGEVVAVQSVAGPNVLPHYRLEDNMCTHLFFAGGALATLLVSHTHSAMPGNPGDWSNAPDFMAAMGHDMSMIFTLTGGSIGLDFIKPAIQINRLEEWPAGSGGARVVHERTEDYSHGSYEFYHDSDKMRREFIRRCAAGLPPVQDPIDAWRSHRVCLAAQQSAREDGRRITVDYTLPEGVALRNADA